MAERLKEFRQKGKNRNAAKRSRQRQNRLLNLLFYSLEVALTLLNSNFQIKVGLKYPICRRNGT